MYMTPNGRIVLDENEKKLGRMVQGKNACENKCKDCKCGEHMDCKSGKNNPWRGRGEDPR